MRAEEKIQRNTIQATTNFWTIISKLLFGIVGWNKKLKIFWRIRSEIDANTFNVRKKSNVYKLVNCCRLLLQFHGKCFSLICNFCCCCLRDNLLLLSRPYHLHSYVLEQIRIWLGGDSSYPWRLLNTSSNIPTMRGLTFWGMNATIAKFSITP